MMRIMGVAIINNGDLFCMCKPSRHHNVIRMIADRYGHDTPIKGEQGFYNEEGEFLTREEARKVAIENGQCEKPDHARLLFSEDLW